MLDETAGSHVVYIAALQVTRVHDLSGHRPVAKEGLCLFVFVRSG